MSEPDICGACPFLGCRDCEYPGGPDPDLLTLKEEQ